MYRNISDLQGSDQIQNTSFEDEIGRILVSEPDDTAVFLSEKDQAYTQPIVERHIYVSAPEYDHKIYIYEDSCLSEDLEMMVRDMVSVYGDEYSFFCLDEYAGMYVDEAGIALRS